MVKRTDFDPSKYKGQRTKRSIQAGKDSQNKLKNIIKWVQENPKKAAIGTVFFIGTTAYVVTQGDDGKPTVEPVGGNKQPTTISEEAKKKNLTPEQQKIKDAVDRAKKQNEIEKQEKVEEQNRDLNAPENKGNQKQVNKQNVDANKVENKNNQQPKKVDINKQIEAPNGNPVSRGLFLQMLKKGEISNLRRDRDNHVAFTLTTTVNGQEVTLNITTVNNTKNWRVFNVTNPATGNTGQISVKRTDDIEKLFKTEGSGDPDSEFIKELENSKIESIQIRHKPGEKNEYIVFTEDRAVIVQHYTHHTLKGLKGTTKLDVSPKLSKQEMKEAKAKVKSLNKQVTNGSLRDKKVKNRFEVAFGGNFHRIQLMDSKIPNTVKQMTK